MRRRILTLLVSAVLSLQIANIGLLVVYHKVAIEQRAETNRHIDQINLNKLERSTYDTRHDALEGKVDELIGRIQKVRNQQIISNNGTDSSTQPVIIVTPTTRK
jgi:hypothetical protein